MFHKIIHLTLLLTAVLICLMFPPIECSVIPALTGAAGSIVKRSIVNDTRILLNTTYDYQLAMSNHNKHPNNMDLTVNNMTLNAIGVSSIIYGNNSNKLQILFVHSEESDVCNFVTTSVQDFIKMNPAIVGAEVLCAGANQSIVLKNPNDNVLTTTARTTTTTTARNVWCWWRPHKHQRCWWNPHKHHKPSAELKHSTAESYEKEREEHHDFNGWHSKGPKSQVVHGRRRRQVSLPTATSLLMIIGLPLPYEIAMGFYDPVGVQNDTDYIASQLYLSAIGLSQKTYVEDDAANLQIQFYFPERSDLCCEASKKAQIALDKINPYYLNSVKVFCGHEKPAVYKPQVPVKSICFCPADWTYFNGSCYLLNNNVTGLWFPQAESFCQTNYNAHLPSVHSVQEQEFISNLLTTALVNNGSTTTKRIWTGMSLRRNETIFAASWSDGSSVDFGYPVGMTPGAFPWGVDPVNGPEPQKIPAETRVVMVLRNDNPGHWADRIPQTQTNGLLCRL